MRDVDGDERDAGLEVLRRNRRRRRIVGLELNRQVDLLANQLLRVAKRDFGLVAVVHDDELDPRVLGRPQQARVDLTRKRSVMSLRRVADSVACLPLDLEGATVAAHVDLLQQPAMVQRVEHPEAMALVESGALDDVAQPQRLAGGRERTEHLRRVHHGFHDVRLARRSGHAGPTSTVLGECRRA